MYKIALVTYNSPPYLSESDKILSDTFKKYGLETNIISWDDTKVQWEQFSVVILRSCWDYHYRIREFLQWLDRLENLHVNVLNPLSIIRWNYHKKYLLELEKKGVSIIPTYIIEKGKPYNVVSFLQENNCDEIIIKPAIGASAYKIFKCRTDNYDNTQKIINNVVKTNVVLIQPLMKEIKNGELSIIFINKKYSHTVLKKPRENEFRSNHEFKATELLYHPETVVINEAKKIINIIKENLLYARVDGILVDGNFVLMELEVIEPHLFFDLFPQGTELFAKSIQTHLDY